ncbi:HAMP domain-containing sensor histidine kinase [uncultured Methylobacterium sp.]|jgi:signal transduction histidine kinase|uniref:sensor histidine kinase n=1 Tax=uncultured Methylobacterium sp. TaxID=157278 RepID=UPI0026030C5A|nr:HAMP domain-containing sensor histidine kinase [uncultured Methylobacterium sp.]
MRVGHRILLVGGLPIAIAALIALAGWLLLAEAERARAGAVLAGTIYRTLTVATTVRDEYLGARPEERADHAERFARLTSDAAGRLVDLRRFVRTADQGARIDDARRALAESVDRMQGLVRITRENDGLIAEMADRAATLIALADQARDRQRAANTDLVASLTEKARRLRLVRDVVTAVNDLRAAVAEAEIGAARDSPGGAQAPSSVPLAASLVRVRNAARTVAAALRDDGRPDEAGELLILAAAYEGSRAGAEPGILAVAGAPAALPSPANVLGEWCERILKLDGTAQRSLHDEVSQLLAYAVQANETEQATQNIALATLKLGQRTAEALSRRDPAAARAMLAEGEALSATAAALPISPLIQGEMIDAIDGWRERLETTIGRLRRQNSDIVEMDRLAATIGETARGLNELFITDADRYGESIRSLLLVGATAGLVLGSAAALAVARSIAGPLRGLQRDMLALAADPSRRHLGAVERRDELGDMARATRVFVDEIGRRERALRRAKEEADRTLAELRQTQADLIQAEKLASLGQLVAGVAHEINTPLGIALTTATLVRDEARDFRPVAAGNQLSRSRLLAYVDRVQEGAHLLAANLSRAADLVHSFKQVAVDRVSDERRRFPMREWLDDLLRSLGPLTRQGGHRLDLVAPETFEAETYPGALAQVVTNLVKNAVVHAFPDGAPPGRIAVALSREGAWVRLEVRDDGRGIAPADRERIFDPFFTTARYRGSSGLGMHIVYNLVTGRLQGRIAVESREGEGTVIRVEFPIEPAPEGAGRRALPAGAAKEHSA